MSSRNQILYRNDCTKGSDLYCFKIYVTCHVESCSTLGVYLNLCNVLETYVIDLIQSVQT